MPRTTTGSGPPLSSDPQGLTVKGQTISGTQMDIAKTLIGVGQKLGAQPVAMVAIIYAGMGETSLGADSNTYQNNGVGFWGVLQGSLNNWPDPHDVVGQATSFYKGGKGFQAGGAISLATRGVANPAQIAIQVEVPSIWPADAYAKEWQGGQAQGVAEAQAIVKAFAGVSIQVPGGVAGLGGTGTPGNKTATSLWTVGDPSNPDQDYWTTINQYSLAAQWYTFTDAETLFVADGIQLMAQQPAAVINRLDPSVVSLRAHWDNTTWSYTHTHVRKARIQRRTSLAKLTSPTMVQVQIICDIDQFRAGDTVLLTLCGPADGPWLIGDCTRSIFDPYSNLTLVQAMSPINAAAGTPSGAQFLSGQVASQPSSGTVMAAMISEAKALNGDNYPYVYGGGHALVGKPSTGVTGGNGTGGRGVLGFDCSGAVAAVLFAGGLWPSGSSVPGNDGIVQQLLSQTKIVPGTGSGSPECSLFNYPGQHIFMRLNGQYFGTESGDLSGPTTALPDNGSGVGWMKNGSPGTAIPYHVPPAILGQQAPASPTG